jgi:hypothetical protein
MIMITLPSSDHRPTNPYETALQEASGFRSLSQLYPNEYPTLPYALQKENSVSLVLQDRISLMQLFLAHCTCQFMLQTSSNTRHINLPDYFKYNAEDVEIQWIE